MELSRNEQHYYVMTIIYNLLTDYTFSAMEVKRDASEIIESVLEMPLKDVPSYIIDTVNFVASNYGAIKTKVSPLLKNWTWERLPLLTQSIILMSYTHFYEVDRADKKVVINVAVNLAKKYIDEKQGKFINALLDKLLK